ncbi:MAG: M23 family metallopeptidase [Gemmatimonadetes bacterium]|nr:M23 family metallopeptidase [Gemmatimonadota bacterium]
MMLLLLAILPGLQAPPPRVTVRWTPARPVQGSLVIIHAQVVAGVPAPAGLTGEFAGELLHFDRDSTGAFVAYGGIPVDARGSLKLPVVVEDSGGVADTVTVQVPVTRARFGSEQLSVDPRFTAPPDSALAVRIAREAAQIRQAWLGAHATPRLWKQPFARPRPSRITSVFGTGREFNGVVQSRHLGLDFDGKVGETVRAANDGVISLVGDFYYSGSIVVVNHGGGIATAYLHLSKVLVNPGDSVKRSQLIGLVGSSGRVTGPHLHWIAKYGTISVNPMSLLTVTAEPKKTPPKRAPARRAPPRAASIKTS